MLSLSSFFVSSENDGDASPMYVAVAVSVSKEREVVTQSQMFAQQETGTAIQSETMGFRVNIPTVIKRVYKYR